MVEWAEFGVGTQPLRNCEGEAGYEAMTCDPTAVTESVNTNSHLCFGCLVIIHPCLALDYSQTSRSQ